MRKNIATLILVVIILYSFIGRSLQIKKQIGDTIHLDLFWGVVSKYVDEQDSMIHNDGELAAVIRVHSMTEESVVQQIEKSIVWERFPLPEELCEVTYDYKLTKSFQSSFAEVMYMPNIENGYWCFLDLDEHRNDRILYGKEAVQDMIWPEGQEHFYLDYPGEFVIAIYDLDHHKLYYFYRTI